MTQAAAVRPKCVEEELQLIQQLDPKPGPSSSLLLSPPAQESGNNEASGEDVTPPEKFMKLMIEWYEGIKKRPKELSTLTKKKLYRKGLNVAARLKLPWRDVPDNWVHRLRDEAGLVCYIKKSIYLQRKKENAKLMKQTMEKEKAQSSEENQSRIVDLTDLPPPGWWLQAYTKGKAPPRRQVTFFDGEKLTIYWDYSTQNWVDFDPKADTVEGKGKASENTPTIVLPHADNGLNWYKNLVQKQKEEDEKSASNLGISYGDYLVKKAMDKEKQDDSDDIDSDFD